MAGMLLTLPVLRSGYQMRLAAKGLGLGSGADFLASAISGRCGWYDEALTPPAPRRSEAWVAAFTDVQHPSYPWQGPLPWDDGPEAVNLAIKARLDKVIAAEAASTVPDQSPAPVRVEERDGKIARVHDRDSPLRAAERDFNAWREPVIDHIEELTSGDFREGTNHGRARDRLVALSNLLPGDIAEVKEQQFRIGYEIERFEGLIAAYRSGGDDMPVPNVSTPERNCIGEPEQNCITTGLALR